MIRDLTVTCAGCYDSGIEAKTNCPLSSQCRSARSLIFFYCRAAAVFLFLWTLSGCSPEPTSRLPRPPFPIPAGAQVLETDGRVGGQLNYSLSGEPSSFNFATSQDNRTHLVTYLITGTLLEFDFEQLTVGPGVARKWSLSPDSRTIRIELREGLRFSDGRAVTAEDVIFTLDRLFQDGSQTTLAASLRIEGQPLGYRQVNDSSVEITFPQKFAAAEYALTTIPVFPAHLMSHQDRKLEDYWTLNVDPSSMAGLGPFVIAEHHPARKTILRYNPHYWKVDKLGQRLPYLDEIVIHYIPQCDTQILRLEAGELDLLDAQVRPSDWTRLEGKGFQLLDAGPSVQLKFLWFNQNPGAPKLSPSKRNWFANADFRRAVSLGISRRAIVENVFQGRAEEAWSLMPSSIRTWHAPSVRKYPYDPAQARRLLMESGFSWIEEGGRTRLVDAGRRPVQFEIFCRSDQQWGRIAAIVQQDLERLGMKVAVRQEEFRALISRVMRSHDYEAAIMGIDFPYEPVEHQNVLFSSSPMHFWNPAQESPATEWEAEVDRLFLKQITTLELEERQLLFTRIQEILAEELPLVPLVNQNILVVASPAIQGLKPVPLFPHTLWNGWELSF